MSIFLKERMDFVVGTSKYRVPGLISGCPTFFLNIKVTYGSSSMSIVYFMTSKKKIFMELILEACWSNKCNGVLEE